MNWLKAYDIGRRVLIPGGATKLADAHEKHIRQVFERRYLRPATDDEVALMKLGFRAVIEGIM